MSTAQSAAEASGRQLPRQGTAFLERTLARHLSSGCVPKDGQPPSRPGTTSARIATTALHESTLKEMAALLEATTARIDVTLRQRFDAFETRLTSTFEQGLEAFRKARQGKARQGKARQGKGQPSF